MYDNNRLELVLSIVDENTASATAKARANIRSFVEEAVKAAQGASNSLDKVTIELARSFEKASGSAMSSLDRLEARAALAGKRGVDRLVAERQVRIKALGEDEAAIQRVTAAYNKLITAEQKGTGEHGGTGSMVLRRGFLAVKDFGEGRVQGTMAEAADILFGQGGTGGVVQKVIPEIAGLTGLGSTAVIAIGSVAAAFVGLQLAGLGAMKSLAEYGQEVENVHLRTGISVQNVEQFAFAAKMGGQDVSIFEKMMRGLSEAESDNSSAGTKARAEMERLGVSTRDATGQLKPTEQILLELSTALEKLPPGTQRNAAAMEIFKRVGIEAIPVISSLTENVNRAKELGLGATKEDLERWEEYHRKITEASSLWDNFVRRIKGVLAATVIITFEDSSGKTLHPDDLRRMGINPRYAGSDSPNLSAQTQADRSLFPGASAAGLDVKGIGGYADQVAAYNRKKAELAKFEQSPEQQLSVAEDQLRAIGKPTVDNLTEYRAAFERVRRLKEADKSSKDNAQDLVAAAKERQQLLAESAQIAESSQIDQVMASLESKKELTSPEDIGRLLDLAKRRAIADENKAINDRRDANGNVSAQYLDAANANLPQRIENEQDKVLAKISVQDARYFRARTDADAKAWDEAFQHQQKGELELQQESINIRQQIQTRQFDVNGSAIDRQKELALQGLDGTNAQTLQQKTALEDQKLAIEQNYAERSLANQVAKLENEQVLAIGKIRERASADGNVGTPAEAAKIAATQDEYQQQIDAARASTSDKEIIDAQKTQAAKEKLQIESSKRVYDSLKQDASGLFDQLVSHTKSWGDFAKDLFKSAILTPIKDIFSSQVAAFFTKAVTGESVKFGEVGNGQGAFGKLGSIFGRAGLGPATFGDANHPLSKLNAPNHLGDVSLVSGAVPVVLMNQGAAGQRTVSNNFSFSSAAAGAGLASLLFGGARSAIGAVAGTPSFTADSTLITDPSQFGGPGGSTGTFGSFSDISKLVGGPGGTSGFAGPVSGYGGSGSGGGIFSNLGSGIFGGLGKLFGRGGGSSEIDGETGLPLGHDIPGSSDNSSGETGNGIGGAAGAALLSIGSGLVMDSLRRKPGLASGIETPLGAGMIGAKFGGKGGALIGAGIGLGVDGVRRGGVTGTIEDAGGGALIGFQLGGPVGALAGAAIGAGVGLFRMLFKTDRQHAKDLVKQVYGMDINNSTADQIVQIAKQSYGSQIDVAVRSPQVRDLLKLYAQTTGQKGAEDRFVQDSVHSASFVESGGKLQQQAVYDNGNAYSYSSPLSVYGGVQTSPLSTFAPNQGVFSGNLQINLNGQSAADALEGRVANVVTPGFVQGQALSASSSSIGRTAQQNMTLSPSALTR